MTSHVRERFHQSAKREAAGAERRGILGGARSIPRRICLRWRYKAVPSRRGWQGTAPAAPSLGRSNPPRARGNVCSNANFPLRLPVSCCTFSSPGIPPTISRFYNVVGNLFGDFFSSDFDSVPPFSMCFGRCFMPLLFGGQTSPWNCKAQPESSGRSTACGCRRAEPSGLFWIS